MLSTTSLLMPGGGALLGGGAAIKIVFIADYFIGYFLASANKKETVSFINNFFCI